MEVSPLCYTGANEWPTFGQGDLTQTMRVSVWNIASFLSALTIYRIKRQLRKWFGQVKKLSWVPISCNSISRQTFDYFEITRKCDVESCWCFDTYYLCISLLCCE